MKTRRLTLAVLPLLLLLAAQFVQAQAQTGSKTTVTLNSGWIGKTDWEYRTTFDAPPALLRRRNVEMVFEGLDTYATVFLNDRQVLAADNMFRTWRVQD